MEEIRADLHMHGPIGFQPYWLEKQGYEGKNLLKELTDSCLGRGVNVCAITSDEDEIPRGSIHDRFNWLKENNAKTLPSGYEFDSLGENVAVVVKDGEMLYLVNGQTVRIDDKGNYVHYLVIGSNEIPNHKDLDWTLKYIQDLDNVFGGAEHGLCETHGGMGLENMENFLSYMSFIEGHNSQLIFPVPGFVPIFGNYRRGLNNDVQNFAEENNKPWISTSDAHRIEDAGISYIESDSKNLDTSSGERVVNSLRDTIKSKNFIPHCKYEKTFSWINWVSKFIAGRRLGQI